MKSETLQIILNGRDFETLSKEDKQQYLKGALSSLNDSLKYGVYIDRKSIIAEIKYLEELRKTAV